MYIHPVEPHGPHPPPTAPMRVTLSKWGNSLGIRIPRGIAQDANIDEGSELDVRLEDGRIVLVPVATPSLDALLARITPDTLHGTLLDEPPIGREEW